MEGLSKAAGMRAPLVSIIIPVYNGSNYLRDAIESALAQTYQNCEVIVVNDGSNDDGATETICLDYGNRINYLKKENGGVATAVNFGIQNMHGDYFAWLSHDDMFYPTKIQEQIRALEQAGDPNRVVFGNFEFLNMENGEKCIFKIESLCDERNITKGIYPILFGLIHFCTVLVPKTRIEEVGMCKEELKTTQDIEWLFRLLRQKESVFLKQPLAAVRLHGEQGKHQIKEYQEEQGVTHMSFLKEITECEIRELFGNRFTFYQQMATFYQGDRNMAAFHYVRGLFDRLPKPESAIRQIDAFKQSLRARSGGNAKKLCIFCAGFYGRKLLYELRKRMLKVDFFSDNNQELWGTTVDQVKCIPPTQIEKQDTLIIVAMEQADPLAIELRNNGYQYVTVYREMIGELLEVTPVCIPE